MGWRGRGILHTSWIFFKIEILFSLSKISSFKSVNIMCVGMAWCHCGTSYFYSRIEKRFACLWICFCFRGCLYSPESSQVSIINPNTKGVWVPPLTKGRGGLIQPSFLITKWVKFSWQHTIVLCCCIQRKVNWSVFFPARAFNFLIPSSDVWLFDHIEYKMIVNKAFMIWKTFIL